MKDYEKIGLKCGVEIHQQIDTSKLFCDCDSDISSSENKSPDYTVERRLNIALSETGEIDDAALHETSKNKRYKYLGYKKSTCLVEFDEEPPHEMNKEALKVALTVAKMLNSTFVDEIHVMRKIVVDGSNPSGFQRTALIAIDGVLNVDNKEISIPTICIEEESAKIIERTPEYDVYDLSRLGIPLIEISTGPDINSPELAKDVCAKIGMILRSTKKVKRGLGTIRQDVNVSIKDGTRIEIKGAQDLKIIPKLIELEVLRQEKLLELKSLLKKKIKNLGNIEIIDLSEIFKNTESKVIKKALSKKGAVLGIRLKHFAGLVGFEVQPNRRVGTEFSDYAKSAGVGGIFHSDELPNYGITNDDIKKIKKKLNCEKEDAFILVAGHKEKSELALKKVIKRAELCLTGVPKEVRKANPDGTTSFLRPMPGAARMYPETDVPPMKNLDPLEIDVPKTIEERISEFEQKYKLSSDLAKHLISSDLDDMFLLFAKKYANIKPSYIGQILTGIVKDVKKQFNKDINPTGSDFEIVFNALDRGLIAKDSVILIFSRLNENSASDLVKSYKLLSNEEILKILEKIIAKSKIKKINVLMGLAMKELKGKASGQQIMKLLKTLLDKNDK